MNDQEWERMRGFIAWGMLGVIIIIGVSIVASLVLLGQRSSAMFNPFFFHAFFPFHFGFLVPIFLIFVIFLLARWIFWPWREQSSHSFTSQCHDNAQSMVKERYTKGEITKEQFEQMTLDLKRAD
jgi:uncharacterized membrane protein